jgi:hypothetical protein
MGYMLCVKNGMLREIMKCLQNSEWQSSRKQITNGGEDLDKKVIQ